LTRLAGLDQRFIHDGHNMIYSCFRSSDVA